MINLFRIKYILVIFVFFIFSKTAIATSFGIKPAYPRSDNPRTESIFIQTLEPGSSINEGVKVINSTEEDKNLLLYTKDSVRSSGGGFACMQFSEKSKGVGSWIKFNIGDLPEEDKKNIKIGQTENAVEILAPKGKEILIPFSITAPKDVSVGEHNGCILIQEIKDKSESAGVSLSMRSGTRVAINIPGDIIRKLEIYDFRIQKRNSAIYLMPSVKNIGNVSIDSDISVYVRNFLGLKHKTFGGEFPVLRDEVYDFNFEFKKPFWGGLYYAQAKFNYDESSESGIGIVSENKKTELVSDKIWFFSFPTIIGLITQIVIFITGLGIFSIWRLSQKKKKWIKTWKEYVVEEGETLSILSNKFRVHWEIIAEVNKIKPPYILNKGDVIRLPQRKNN